MSTVAISESLFLLPIADRVAIADQLYASVPEDWQRATDAAWLAEAEKRSAEMDNNPDAEMTHEAFLAGIKTLRRSA